MARNQGKWQRLPIDVSVLPTNNGIYRSEAPIQTLAEVAKIGGLDWE